MQYQPEQTDSLAPAVVHVSGRIRSLETGWSPIGWSGRTDVVLAKHDQRYGVRELALFDVETGEMRAVFP